MAGSKSRDVQLMERAMQVTEPEEARKIYNQLVEISMMEHGKSHDEATSIIKENLGYRAGYHSDEIRHRVEDLFDCEHPVFGKISINGSPTFDEAFRLGQLMVSGDRMTLSQYRERVAAGQTP